MTAFDPELKQSTGTAAALFPSGFGQHDTHARVLSDGRPNLHPSAGTPYGTIAVCEIEHMMRQPPGVPKEKARWFMPSLYAGFDAREFAVQRKSGLYGFLTLDIDKNNLAIGDVRAALDATTPGCTQLIYSTRSATATNRKWRALIPLADQLPGGDFDDIQEAFFDLLEGASNGVLLPDRALARAGQLVYLPNRGDHYERHIQRGNLLALDSAHPIVIRREANRADRHAAEVATAQVCAERAAWRRQSQSDDDEKPIDHFNAAHTVAEMLARFGYQQAGGSNDWRSPFQSSGSFATRDYGEYWISLSSSDAVNEIGAPTKSGHCFGDAFDLYRHFVHRGDQTAAIREYAEQTGIGRKAGVPPGGAAMSDGKDRPNDRETFDLSQDALALEMERAGWAGDAKFANTWAKWLFWTGTHWRKDNQLEHMTRTRAFLRRKAEDLVEWAERKAPEAEAEKEGAGERLKARAQNQAQILRSKNTVAAVESLARSNAALVASAGDFDADRMILGTPGGTVELRTGILRPALREDLIIRQTSVTPAQGRPSRWLEFLSEIFAGDAELIAFMQRAAGYACTGQTREHKLLFLYGTGRNGKSVFLNTLFHILGDYARRAHAATFLNSVGEKHPTDLAGLQGARLVVGSELPKGKTWDESTIKDLTGGDVLAARFMRGDFFEFEPQLTLFIAGNNMPSFRGVDEAIRARVVLIPFNVTFPADKRDPHLSDKLKVEAPQILQWAIEGALEWQARGLDVPPNVAAASATYFDDEDELGQFLGDEIVADPSGFVTTTMLHERFRQWCDAQGLNHWTLRTLQKEVCSRGWQEARRNHGRGFSGMRLR